jgi:TPR repeat protein
MDHVLSDESGAGEVNDMNVFAQLLLIALAINIGACAPPVSNSTEKEMKRSEEIGMPTSEQLPALKKEAMEGSTQAAMQLSLWHMKYMDHEADLYWMRIASENGSPVAQYGLGQTLLSDKSDPLNAIRGRFWLMQSAKKGDKWAAEELAKLDAAAKK